MFRAHAMDKVEMLARILQAEGRGLTMVFCRTKRTAQKVSDELADRGFAAGAVHGDLGQGAREQAMRAFRNGKVDVLVATDVAARGIDVEGVTHVVNYQCPEDEKTYLHRIGRTARAGAKGIAVTFVDWDDIPRWTLINKALGLGFDEPPETYSTSDHLYEALDIPGHVTGVLPRADRTREGLDAEAVEDIGETGMRSKRPASSSHGSGSGRSSSSSSASSSSRSSSRESSSSKPSRTKEEVGPTGGDEPKSSARRASGSRTRTRGGASSSGEKASTGERPADAAPADGAPKRSRRRRGRRGSGSGAEAAGTSAPAAS